MPSRYQKDIYNYYPRPAIKQAPKKNTPVYMETLRPQKQQNKYNGGGNQGSPYLDFQGFDFSQLQNIDFKYLQDLIHQAKEISLPNLNLPHGDKPLEIVEVSLDSLRQGNQNYGSRHNSGFPRGRNIQRNNKGGYRKRPQGRAPSQSPMQYEYISFAKNNPILPQSLNTLIPATLPKELEITPIQLPHSIPSIDELLKSIQVPAIPFEVNNNKGGFNANYGKENAKFNHQQQYRTPPQKSQQSAYAQPSFYSHKTEQPRKYHTPTQNNANNIKFKPDIDAELIKLGEHELKHLLSNLHVLDKNPNDLLKYLPIENIGHSKNENVQLILSLPEAGFNEGENSPVRTYNTHKSTQHVYGNEGQFGGIIPKSRPHQTKEVSSYSVNTGGYQIANHESYEQHEAAGYEAQNQAPRTNAVHYEQPSYQSAEGQQGYEKQQGYRTESEQHQTGYEAHQTGHEGPQAGYEAKENEEQYAKGSPEPSGEHQGSYGQQEQSYIQVISQQTDENGYRREPVLAVEIQHGQTIEDAIKSLDPETLQKIGRHGENGIEIEVVEVPVDEYASESKKTETVVSAKNSTIEAKSNATVTAKT